MAVHPSRLYSDRALGRHPDADRALASRRRRCLSRPASTARIGSALGLTRWANGGVYYSGVTTALAPNTKIVMTWPDTIDSPGRSLTGAWDWVSIDENDGGPTYAALTASSYHIGGVNALFGDGQRQVRQRLDQSRRLARSRHRRRRRGGLGRLLLIADVRLRFGSIPSSIEGGFFRRFLGTGNQ